MFPRNMLPIRTENGYGLVSLSIAVAIMAIIIGGIMMAIFQIYNVSSANTNHLIAIREVQNAGRWLALDAQRADNIETSKDSDGFPLTINWDDPDDNQHEVVYDMLLDNKLQRQHYTNRTVNPDPDATTLIALFVDPSNTSCTVSQNNELVAKITSAVDTAGMTYTETRTYRVFPRGGLQ